MNEEQMASGFETIDETSYPVVKLDVGLATRRGESTEIPEDLTVVGFGLLVRAALDIAKVALAQAVVAVWLAPRQTRGLNRPLEVRRPHAGEFPAVEHRPKIGGLATADSGQRRIAPTRHSLRSRESGLPVADKPKLQRMLHGGQG